MTQSNPINEALSELLKARGFKRKSKTWYAANDECISVVNLQKSQYGDQYYINFGVALRALSPPDFPKEYQCHIRFRLEATLPESERHMCKTLMDLENISVTPGDRKAAVRQHMETYGVTLLRACSSVEGIAQAYGDGRLNGAMVHKEARELFV